MKINKLLWLISLSAAVTLNFTSCKDDDKNDEVKPEEKTASVNITVTNDKKTVEGATVYMYSGEDYDDKSAPKKQNALTNEDTDKDGIAKFTINATDLDGAYKKSFYFVVFNDKSEKAGEVEISLKAGETKEGTIDITPEEEPEPISQFSATVNDGKFSTKTAGFWSSKSSDNTGTRYLEKIFGTLDGATTIMGTGYGKQMSISIKGTTSGTYEQRYNVENDIFNSVVAILSGEGQEVTLTDSEKKEISALIIYRATGAVEGDNDYWFSTQANVTFDNSLNIYAQGTFVATMRNKAGDSFTITDGSFKVFGKSAK